MFDNKLFQQLLDTSWVGHELILLEEIDSTNNYAKQIARAVPGTIILAEDQTAGKGNTKRLGIQSPKKSYF